MSSYRGQSRVPFTARVPDTCPDGSCGTLAEVRAHHAARFPQRVPQSGRLDDQEQRVEQLEDILNLAASWCCTNPFAESEVLVLGFVT